MTMTDSLARLQSLVDGNEQAEADLRKLVDAMETISGAAHYWSSLYADKMRAVHSIYRAASASDDNIMSDHHMVVRAIKEMIEKEMPDSVN